MLRKSILAILFLLIPCLGYLNACGCQSDLSSQELQKSDSCVFIKPPYEFTSELEVAGCFCEYEGKILYLLRNPEKPQGNTWCIPGGKLEKQETARQAVIREVEEETGIKISNEALKACRTVFVRFPKSEFTLHLFRAHLESIPDELQLSYREHSSYRWVTYEEALQLPLIPGGEECLRLACMGNTKAAQGNHDTSD